MGNISISRKAVAGLRKQLVQKCFEAGVGFRMLVNTDNSGKATFTIKLDKKRQRDEVIQSGDVNLFLDPSSAARISGYQLDYQDEPGGGFFLSTMQEVKGG